MKRYRQCVLASVILLASVARSSAAEEIDGLYQIVVNNTMADEVKDVTVNVPGTSVGWVFDSIAGTKKKARLTSGKFSLPGMLLVQWVDGEGKTISHKVSVELRSDPKASAPKITVDLKSKPTVTLTK